jgi:hypothetical protein
MNLLILAGLACATLPMSLPQAPVYVPPSNLTFLAPGKLRGEEIYSARFINDNLLEVVSVGTAVPVNRPPTEFIYEYNQHTRAWSELSSVPIVVRPGVLPISKMEARIYQMTFVRQRGWKLTSEESASSGPQPQAWVTTPQGAKHALPMLPVAATFSEYCAGDYYPGWVAAISPSGRRFFTIGAPTTKPNDVQGIPVAILD